VSKLESMTQKQSSKEEDIAEEETTSEKTEGEFKASQKLFSVCVYVLFGWNRFSYAFKCIYCN
jgi:hypothetical protein